MKSVKSVLFVAFAAAVIIYLIIGVLQPDYDSRYKDIVKEYDGIYSERIDEYESEKIIRCYKSGEQVCFIALGIGYEDDILIFAEFSDESVEKVKILYHNETEDYGDLVVEDWFLNRLCLPYDTAFETVKIAKEESNEIIAITGATITSEAVVNAINLCINIMEEMKDE